MMGAYSSFERHLLGDFYILCRTFVVTISNSMRKCIFVDINFISKMKKIILVFLVSLWGSGLSAQNKDVHVEEYVGLISFGGDVGVTEGVISNSFSLLTLYGANLGHGEFVGCGTGLKYDFCGAVKLPVFLAAKYSFRNEHLSPFVDFRIGGEMIFKGKSIGGALIVSPAVGVDFSAFSFRVGYLCEAGRYIEKELVDDRLYIRNDILMKLHSISMTLSYYF